MQKYIEINDLDEKSFIGKQTGSVVKIEPKISNQSGNRLSLTPQGLFVADGSTSEYELEETRFVTVPSNGGTASVRQRKLLSTFGKLGMVTLVFRTSRSDRHTVFNLPANAPTPNHLVSVQTYTGGLIWIEPNSRAVVSNSLRANTDYSVTLIGFFS